MSQTPLIEIYAYGDPRVGFGHIRRSFSLYKHLSLRFSCRIKIDRAGSLEVYTSNCSEDDVCNLILFDSPTLLDQQIEAEKIAGTKTVALDYFGHAEPHLTICVFNHDQNQYPGRRTTGFEYIIVREDIRKFRDNFGEKTKHILVALGGGDILGMGPWAAEELSSTGEKILLIEGPFAKPSHLRIPNVEIVVNPENFAELMFYSSFGVTNGGGCMFEMMCLGKPCCVLPQTEFELTIARKMIEKSAILGIGLSTLQTIDKDKFKETAHISRQIVDGLGVNRIERHIEEVLCI